MMFNGRNHVVYGNETVQGLKLMLNGKTCMFRYKIYVNILTRSTEYDPTKLRATTAGIHPST